MHKSKLGCMVIDCKTDNLDRDTEFWSEVFGHEIVRRDDLGDDNYRALETEATQPRILIQKVDHPSRVHLDIETDNIELEVDRLVKLGARKIEKIRDWCVMEAPSGHRFCVVPSKRKNFEATAKTWD